MDASLTFSSINGRSVHDPVDHQAARTQVVAEKASTEACAGQKKAPMFASSNLAQYLTRKFACHVTVHLDGQAAVEDMEALNLDWLRIEGPDMQLKVRKCQKAAVIVACAGFIHGTTPAGSFDLRPGQDFVFVPDLSELDLAIRASDTRSAQFLIFLFERNELEDVALYPQSGRPASLEEDGLRILALQRLQMIRRPEASTMLELQFRLAQSATAVCGLGEKMRVHQALLQILNAFLVERGKQNPAVGHRSETGTLEDICIQLTGMLDPDLTVASVAQMAGVTTRTLQLWFKRNFGCTPGQWLLRQRLLAARRRLEAPADSDNVTSIASGYFNNLGDFSRRYRNAFGERPSATLQKARAKQSMSRWRPRNLSIDGMAKHTS